MAVRDFQPRPQGAEPDSVPHQNWLDALGQRQNIDLQQELTSVASGDEIGIFDVSETGQVKFKKITKENLVKSIKGVSTNTNAASGNVGEYVSSQILFSNAISLTTNVAVNVTSISLTAGDWDVSAHVAFNNGGAATITDMLGAINTTSATFPTEASDPAFTIFTLPITTGAAALFPVGTKRLLLSSTTTVYLVSRAAFTGGTVGVSGFIGARRSANTG